MELHKLIADVLTSRQFDRGRTSLVVFRDYVRAIAFKSYFMEDYRDEDGLSFRAASWKYSAPSVSFKKTLNNPSGENHVYIGWVNGIDEAFRYAGMQIETLVGIDIPREPWTYLTSKLRATTPLPIMLFYFNPDVAVTPHHS